MSFVQDRDGLVHEGNGAGKGSLVTPCGRLFAGVGLLLVKGPATCMKCMLALAKESDASTVVWPWDGTLPVIS